MDWVEANHARPRQKLDPVFLVPAGRVIEQFGVLNFIREEAREIQAIVKRILFVGDQRDSRFGIKRARGLRRMTSSAGGSTSTPSSP